ncbi:unnamed protein product [Staurois parvus]|uniref:Uncharacterized protein n=1 Tax=Staurois parvus TaxID=386267 RepID=A0ABN9CFZ3_9NEOB|nr:unnamed protein product [Staurois parvus]
MYHKRRFRSPEEIREWKRRRRSPSWEHNDRYRRQENRRSPHRSRSRGKETYWSKSYKGRSREVSVTGSLSSQSENYFRPSYAVGKSKTGKHHNGASRRRRSRSRSGSYSSSVSIEDMGE